MKIQYNCMVMLPKTKCLKIEADGVTIENADGIQKLPADTVIYALGMKSVNYDALKEVLGDTAVYVVGDAIRPAKVDLATRSGYLAAVSIASEDVTGVDTVQY